MYACITITRIDEHPVPMYACIPITRIDGHPTHLQTRVQGHMAALRPVACTLMHPGCLAPSTLSLPYASSHLKHLKEKWDQFWRQPPADTKGDACAPKALPFYLKMLPLDVCVQQGGIVIGHVSCAHLLVVQFERLNGVYTACKVRAPAPGAPCP